MQDSKRLLRQSRQAGEAAAVVSRSMDEPPTTSFSAQEPPALAPQRMGCNHPLPPRGQRILDATEQSAPSKGESAQKSNSYCKHSALMKQPPPTAAMMKARALNHIKSTELSTDAPGQLLWTAEALPSANEEGAILPRKR